MLNPSPKFGLSNSVTVPFRSRIKHRESVQQTVSLRGVLETHSTVWFANGPDSGVVSIAFRLCFTVEHVADRNVHRVQLLFNCLNNDKY